MAKRLEKIRHALWCEWIKRFTKNDILDLGECVVEVQALDNTTARDAVRELSMPSRPPDGTYHTFEPYGPHPRDSDGAFPIWNNQTDVNFATTFTHWSTNGPTKCYQKYNTQKILSFNPGPNDWMHIRRHERAHASGWHHWEGTPETNAAYHPVVMITHT